MGVKSRILVGLAEFGFRWRFLAAKATRIAPVGRLVDHMLFDEDDMMYLPRDSVAGKVLGRSVTVQVDKSFEVINVVLPSQILEHFIRESKYHFIMDFCVCREANDCKDYPKHYGCLFLGKGVLKIDRKYGKLVSTAEALEHVRKCREAGLVHLIGRNKIDSVVFDTGRKEDLLSICNCCPCCCLWKMIPQLNSDIGSGVTRMPGVSVSLNEACTGCGRCVEDAICFVNAISIRDGTVNIDQERCRGCGRCVEYCPHGAIELKIDDRDFFMKSVHRIEPLVNVKAE